jgi:DNA-binding PadR family transcriptional regulator
MRPSRPSSPGEWAVLALLCERDAHGWALARQLAPEGEIGRIWSIKRALVYRALETLQQKGLIAPVSVEQGERGPGRTILRPTRAGRAAVRSWLQEPVDHVRDVRSLLLLKLTFNDRCGGDPRPLLEAQRTLLVAIEQALDEAPPPPGRSEVALRQFRLETTRAAIRFVEGARERAEARPRA